MTAPIAAVRHVPAAELQAAIRMLDAADVATLFVSVFSTEVDGYFFDRHVERARAHLVSFTRSADIACERMVIDGAPFLIAPMSDPRARTIAGYRAIVEAFDGVATDDGWDLVAPDHLEGSPASDTFAYIGRWARQAELAASRLGAEDVDDPSALRQRLAFCCAHIFLGALGGNGEAEAALAAGLLEAQAIMAPEEGPSEVL